MEVRLAEVVASLSLASDLGNGQPLETALTCMLVGLDLARAHGLSEEDRESVYWAGMLRFVGCTATSPEDSGFGGDDLDLRAVMLTVDFADPADLAARLDRDLNRTLDADARRRELGRFFELGPAVAPAVFAAHCEVAVRLAERFELPAHVMRTLDSYHERWDGLGPRGRREEEVPAAARAMTVAQAAVSNARAASPEELRAILRRRAGGQLDPRMVETFLGADRELLAPMRRSSVWDDAIAAEPGTRRTVEPTRFGAFAAVLADYADLKSPFTVGHSRGVAHLARGAAIALGLGRSDVDKVEHAALLHDLGRVSVPNGIWDKPGSLNHVERERVRRHAYETERILAAVPALVELARCAGSDHERLDGSGYPRAAGMQAELVTRILAAADAYHAMREDRAHRPAHAKDRAAALLREDTRAYDARVVEAVLEVAGEKRRAGGTWPAGLSDREIEVLHLLARGLTNKEIAAKLDISPRTVQQHSLNIYGKLGVSTRAAAALFAAEHGL